jgi:hypothetical protein
MKPFSEFINEEKPKDQTKASLNTAVINNLLRLKSNKKANIKDILMLIAALSMINSADDSSLSLAAARRLVSSGNSPS